MLPSVILNAADILLVLGCLVWGLKKSDTPGRFFRYFTTLSNLLCALSAAVVTACLLCGDLPAWALILKYVGTCAVTVTMLTVLLFLWPISGDWKLVLWGGELILHLICPLLALVSFIFFEKLPMPAWVVALGASPVLLYGALYCRKVVFAPEGRRWEDFYCFNVRGRWWLSGIIMFTGAALVALALWAL